MGTIVRQRVVFGGGGSSDNSVWISKEDYNRLSEAEKNSDTEYYVYDDDSVGNAYAVPFTSDLYEASNTGDALVEVGESVSSVNESLAHFSAPNIDNATFRYNEELGKFELVYQGGNTYSVIGWNDNSFSYDYFDGTEWVRKWDLNSDLKPDLQPVTSNFGTVEGGYRKVGNLVYLDIKLSLTSQTAPTPNVSAIVSGLPDSLLGYEPLMALNLGSGKINFCYTRVGDIKLTLDSANNGVNSGVLVISGCYMCE